MHRQIIKLASINYPLTSCISKMVNKFSNYFYIDKYLIFLISFCFPLDLYRNSVHTYVWSNYYSVKGLNAGNYNLHNSLFVLFTIQSA